MAFRLMVMCTWGRGWPSLAQVLPPSVVDGVDTIAITDRFEAFLRTPKRYTTGLFHSAESQDAHYHRYGETKNPRSRGSQHFRQPWVFAHPRQGRHASRELR